jgi:hypothetical protein
MYCLSHLGDGSYRLAVLNALCLAGLLTQLALVAVLIFHRADYVVLLVALGGAGLAILGDVAVYNDFWAFMRVFNWLPLGCWLASIYGRWRVPAAALALAGLVPVAVVVQAILKHGAL